MQWAEASLIARVTPTPRWLHSLMVGWWKQLKVKPAWRNPFFFFSTEGGHWRFPSAEGRQSESCEDGRVKCVCAWMCACAESSGWSSGGQEGWVVWWEVERVHVLMGEKGITGYVALSTGCSELFRAEEKLPSCSQHWPERFSQQDTPAYAKLCEDLGLDSVQETFGSSAAILVTLPIFSEVKYKMEDKLEVNDLKIEINTLTGWGRWQHRVLLIICKLYLSSIEVRFTKDIALIISQHKYAQNVFQMNEICPFCVWFSMWQIVNVALAPRTQSAE